MQPGHGVPGVFGTVEAVLPWDPDGAGPLGEHLVVGGTFSLAGTVRTNGIALFDPVSGQWTALGNLRGYVKALAVLPNGDLVAGGAGLSIGLVNANSIARWDGTAWSMLGSGITTPPPSAPEVRALAVRPNGDLIAVGQFFQAGGLPVGCMARWNGFAWSSIGDLAFPLLPSADAVVALSNGDVVVGGMFSSAGGVPCTSLARWDGTTWFPLGSGIAPPTGAILSYISSLAVLPNGDVIAAGLFGFAGGQPVNNIARWDGSAWSPLGPGLGTFAYSLQALPNGHVLAGGHQILGTQPVARWNGTSWSGMGSLPQWGALALTSMGNGELFAGGAFRPQGAFRGRGLARWNGIDWEGVAGGNDGAVEKVVAFGDGRLLVVGDLRSVGGVSVMRAAIFDGQAWRAAGELASGTVQAAAALPNGDAVVAVRPSELWSNTQCTVQRWDGTTWNTIGVTSSLVTSMAVAPNGDLYMGGDFTSVGLTVAQSLAVWDGTTWSAAPQSPMNSVAALLFQRDGQLVASAGSFPGFIARWDGSQWVPMGGGLQQPATGLALRPNGDVVAIGNWAIVNGAPCVDIARFDGTAWQALGTGVGVSLPQSDRVTSVATLPNGDVLAAGSFSIASGVPVHNVARWDGTSWHDFGSGADGVVASVVTTRTGAVALGGSFLTVDGQVSAFVARVEPTCPGLAVRYGTSCFGAPESLRIEELAFAGGVMRSRVDGFVSGSLVLSVLGFSPAQLPLPSLLPQGALGCSLLAAPDFLGLAATSGATARGAFAIPRAPVLVGALLYHQTLPVEPAAASGFALKGSNGQALVIGGLW
ncbi:MAG TPA: hypothetical protein VF384_04645 [Planctomycetota bacterium]